MCRYNKIAMPKFHKQLHFNNKVLQQLITTENSCVEVLRKCKHITLFPYHLKNIIASIKEILSEGIARYNSDLEGILLGYKNIKLLSNLGHLNNDACFIHMDIQADFYVFKPVIGKELPATITKKSKDHVGCLVYHMFNVSLPKPEGIENWTGNDVEIGQDITIRITYSNLDEKLPYIRGEFLNNISEFSNTTTSKRITFNDSDENQKIPKVKEKKKKHTDAVEQDSSELHESPKKKKRKSRGSEVVYETDQVETIVKKKRKISHLDDQTNGDEQIEEKVMKKQKISHVEADQTNGDAEPSPKKKKKSKK